MNLKKRMFSTNCWLFFLFFFFLCSFAHRSSNYSKIASQISNKYAKEFASPRRLFFTGYGGAMMNDVEKIELRFISFDALDVDEARLLYVEMMEEFLHRINTDKYIRPYLHNFPFDVDNVHLVIGFENSERRITRDGHLAMVFIGRNHTVFYEAYDPCKEEFYTLYEEPYKEAVQLVKQRSFDLRNSGADKPRDLLLSKQKNRS